MTQDSTPQPVKRGLSTTAIVLIIVGAVGAILLVIVAGLVAIMLPALSRAREAASRAACAANLNQITRAMFIYANENDGKFVRTVYDAQRANQPVCYTGANAINPFVPDGPAANDVSAPIFWLMRVRQLPPKGLICPSSIHQVFTGNINQMSNFPAEGFCSYSMANPYPSNQGLGMSFMWNFALGADFPIFADLNPGAAAAVPDNAPVQAVRAANSANHGHDGQNVAFADGHVAWTVTPFVGKMILGHKDNIYCRNGYTGNTNDPQVAPTGDPIMGPPTSQDDAVMLPAQVGK